MSWAIAGAFAGVLLLSVLGGRWATGRVLRRWQPDPPDGGIARGGAWIGMLERLAITGAVLAGFPEAVAVVLAVKGLGRYPELREPHPDRRGPSAELFIIGTLVSYTWAGACAVLGLWARHALG
ncbi:hypothetical protein [Georgenia sp. MJ170]|uniref:hypothetical protein n=1 Tax=Georgenia sunbinii TaxID=3117728 RepID=UPI002F260F26